MAKESTTVTDKKSVPSNPMDVEWPQDVAGFSTMLRKEGVRAAGRVNGKKDKLSLLIETLDTLKAHAVSRYKAQKEIEAQADRSAEQRAIREAERAERFRQQQIAKYRAEVERLEGAHAELTGEATEGSRGETSQPETGSATPAPAGRNSEPMTAKEKKEAQEAKKLPAANPVTYDAPKPGQ
tara:strand:+ start:33256 stop:33801 length:546 start_codon:yes stop_codon:yes gene_type:complete